MMCLCVFGEEEKIHFEEGRRQIIKFTRLTNVLCACVSEMENA